MNEFRSTIVCSEIHAIHCFFAPSVVCSWLTLAFPITSKGTLCFRPTVEVHFMLPQRSSKGCLTKDPRWDNTCLLTHECLSTIPPLPGWTNDAVHHFSMCVFPNARWTAGPWEFCSMPWCTAACRLTGPATPHSLSKSLKAVTAGPTPPQVKGCLIWLGCVFYR